MRIEEKGGFTRSATPCDPESGKTAEIDSIMERNGPHKYNTRSSTKRVSHMTTFKTTPNMFKMDAAEKITAHKDTDYLSHIDRKKYTITVEPIANHFNNKTTGKF